MFFGPLIDGVTILQDPYSYIAEGKINGISCLIGNNKTEATTIFAAYKNLKRPTKTIFNNVFGDNGDLVLKQFDNELKNSDTISSAAFVFTNYLYSMHSFRLANALADKKIPVYVYRFDYGKSPLAAGHGMELPYVWYNPSTNIEPTGQALDIFRVVAKGGEPLANLMHQSWVSFIKTGDPNYKGLPKWEHYSRDKMNSMIFDENTETESRQ